jgi:hypothetical protein
VRDVRFRFWSRTLFFSVPLLSTGLHPEILLSICFLMAQVDQEQVALPSGLDELHLVNLSTNVTDLLKAQVSPNSSQSGDNLKRSDPFQFGSRYLQANDDVFEFNAWDHVETDDAYKEYAEVQYTKQREAPVSDFDKSKRAISIYLSHGN